MPGEHNSSDREAKTYRLPVRLVRAMKALAARNREADVRVIERGIEIQTQSVPEADDADRDIESVRGLIGDDLADRLHRVTDGIRRLEASNAEMQARLDERREGG